MTAIKHFALNTIGTDYACGDIHGCFSALQTKLDSIGFNPDTDRLFSVGDLVDRGQESEDALEWLSKPWFHAVRGNHEEMAIDYSKGYGSSDIYRMNGGAWFLGLTKPEQQLFVDAFSCLPIAIDVETPNGLVGIIHAECPTASWNDLEDALSGPRAVSYENVAMWNRDKINSMNPAKVQDVYRVYVGHTPLKNGWKVLGNVYYIDTGLCFKGKLTMFNMTTGEEV